MTSQPFTYNKSKVIQALRYHFLTKREIKLMIILVNVFAVISAALFFFRKVSPFAFLISSTLWFVLMITFWFVLPKLVYKKAATFKDSFIVTLTNEEFHLQNERGEKYWPWKAFISFIESPHFFHLYFDASSFFIIPKDAFTGDDVHEARKIFTTKISNN